jgi:hypothetical protein
MAAWLLGCICICMWMSDVAAAWLMTTLTSSRYPIGSSSAEFERQLADEIVLNRRLVQELQITAD